MCKNWQVAYKVLKQNYNNILCSTNSVSILEYKLDTIIEPIILNSKLFVFKDLHLAKSYVDWFGGSKHLVYKCLVDDLIESRLCFPVSSMTMQTDFEIYWSNRIKIFTTGRVTEAPIGTYHCNKLKLLEQIK